MDNNSNPSSATTDFTPAPPSPEPAIETLGRYQLRQEIGQGAFGIVFRAYDPVLDREVALKIPKFPADRSDLRERFLREAKAAARLRHRYIVTVHDCGSEGDRLFIAFELVTGQPLSEHLTTERLAYRQIAQWVRDLALALYHAHDQGVLHRDVKPANILIDSNRQCRLTDFGLSKDILGSLSLAEGTAPADAALTREGIAPGTPAYMAPEQARGDTAAVGPLTDQYSLGVVLYELLTGHRPYEGATDRVIAQAADPKIEPKRPRELNPGVPSGLEAIAWKALRKDPPERFADLSQMAVELQRWLQGDAAAADRQGSAAEGGPTEPILEHPVWYPTRRGLWAVLLAVWLLPSVLCPVAALGYIAERQRAIDEAGRIAEDRFYASNDRDLRIRQHQNYQPDPLTCLRTGFASLSEAPSILKDMSRYSFNGRPIFPIWWFVAGDALYFVGLPAGWVFGRLRYRIREFELVQAALAQPRVHSRLCLVCGGRSVSGSYKCLHCGAAQAGA